MTLVSDSEMAALRGVAESGMATPISIYHLVRAASENGQVSSYPATADETVLGWITETTAVGARIGIDSGVIGTTETHRLMVPTGTDIRNADKVVAGASTYIVQTVADTDTYQPALKAYMRAFE